MQIPFQGLCNPDGSLSERVFAAGEIAKIVREYADFFSASSPPASDVAILYSRTTHISAYGEGVVDAYFDSIKGTYRAFWEDHIGVDFLTPKEMIDGCLEKYKLLMMPFSYTLNDIVGAKVGEFVQSGGTVFAEARCALTDDHGWLHYPLPGAGLSKVFGASERSVTSTPSVELKMSSASPHLAQSLGKVMVGAGFKEVLEPEGSEILGEFDVKEPAITLNRYGMGHAVLAGSYLGLAYVRYGNPIFRMFVRDLLSISGVEERLRVETVPGEVGYWIEAKALETSDSAMIFLINHSDQLVNVDLAFKSAKGFKKAVDVLNKELVAMESEEAWSSFRRKIEAGECAVTLLED
jgi:beta-galactosidase GanA